MAGIGLAGGNGAKILASFLSEMDYKNFNTTYPHIPKTCLSS